LVAWLVIQLSTKNTVKDAASTLSREIGEVLGKITAHEAADKVMHDQIGAHFEATDARVTRLEDRSFEH